MYRRGKEFEKFIQRTIPGVFRLQDKSYLPDFITTYATYRHEDYGIENLWSSTFMECKTRVVDDVDTVFRMHTGPLILKSLCKVWESSQVWQAKGFKKLLNEGFCIDMFLLIYDGTGKLALLVGEIIDDTK